MGGVPVGLGTLSGLAGLPGGTSTLFFAAAVGATIYVTASILAPEAGRGRGFTLGVLTGFLYMFFAGVLHQFG